MVNIFTLQRWRRITSASLANSHLSLSFSRKQLPVLFSCQNFFDYQVQSIKRAPSRLQTTIGFSFKEDAFAKVAWCQIKNFCFRANKKMFEVSLQIWATSREGIWIFFEMKSSKWFSLCWPLIQLTFSLCKSHPLRIPHLLSNCWVKNLF